MLFRRYVGYSDAILRYSDNLFGSPTLFRRSFWYPHGILGYSDAMFRYSDPILRYVDSILSISELQILLYSMMRREQVQAPASGEHISWIEKPFRRLHYVFWCINSTAARLDPQKNLNDHLR